MSVKLSILVGGALFALAANAAGSQFPGSGADPSSALERLNFKLLDFDGSTSISREEFETMFSVGQGEPDAFDFVDFNHDGSITRIGIKPNVMKLPTD